MQIVLRFSIFVLVLVIVAASEYFWPRRILVLQRIKRWPTNFGIGFLNAILIYALPISLTAFAIIAKRNGWVFFSLVYLTDTITIIVSIIILDLVIYIQHVIFHKIPILWRLHRTHHTDTEFDVSTALRFHPVEILISLGIKLSVIAILGIPPEAVLLFEIILNASAMFNHGNLHLPQWLDKWLRYIIITPDMHRVHHSPIIQETNSNYGFNISLWDRLFRTYHAQPQYGHKAMTIGLDEFRNPSEMRLDKLLTQPFRNNGFS